MLPSPQMDEIVQLSYLQWQDKYLVEKPYQVFVPLPRDVPEERASNLDFALGNKEIIKDIRSTSTVFTLDENGFATSVMEMSPHLFSESEIRNRYLPAICDLVKNAAKADCVVPFDWRIRNSVSPVKSGIIDMNNNMIPLLPARHVHIDQTPASALQRVELHAPEELHRFQTGRVQIINAWKPLNEVVKDWPLAVCDATSVSSEELIAVDHVRRHYTGESHYMMYSSAHRWWYLSEQKRNEVMLLKMYDSSKTGGGGCPHASFPRPDAVSLGSSRESIEVRMLVFSS